MLNWVADAGAVYHLSASCLLLWRFETDLFCRVIPIVCALIFMHTRPDL